MAYRRALILLALYFAQGLPHGFFGIALPALMRRNGYSLGSIGATSILALPWVLKLLWAPLLDRYSLLPIGRRRGWILPLLLSGAACMLWLAFQPEILSSSLFAVVFLMNMIAATQDIATDGLTVEILPPKERGLANGIQVGGYRIGMIVGGGALIGMIGLLGWHGSFLAVAVLLLACALVLLAPETKGAPRPPDQRISPPWAVFRQPGGWAILVILLTYKAGDAMGTKMIVPWLVDGGLSDQSIGWLKSVPGAGGGLAGALIGGLLLRIMGRKAGLLLFGITQVLALSAYAMIEPSQVSSWGLNVAIAWEHITGGMATVALFTCMMDWCRSTAHAGADYASQASLVVLMTMIASGVSGWITEILGYSGLFYASAALCGLAVVVAWLLYPATPGPQLRS